MFQCAAVVGQYYWATQACGLTYTSAAGSVATLATERTLGTCYPDSGQNCALFITSEAGTVLPNNVYNLFLSRLQSDPHYIAAFTGGRPPLSSQGNVCRTSTYTPAQLNDLLPVLTLQLSTSGSTSCTSTISLTMTAIDGYLSRTFGSGAVTYCAAVFPSDDQYGPIIFGDSFLQAYTVRSIMNYSATVPPQICFAGSQGCPSSLPAYVRPQSSSTSVSSVSSVSSSLHSSSPSLSSSIFSSSAVSSSTFSSSHFSSSAVSSPSSPYIAVTSVTSSTSTVTPSSLTVSALSSPLSSSSLPPLSVSATSVSSAPAVSSSASTIAPASLTVSSAASAVPSSTSLPSTSAPSAAVSLSTGSTLSFASSSSPSSSSVSPSPSSSSSSSANGAAYSDPYFAGFWQQLFYVHGVAGQVYSLLSDAQVQLNARLVFLSNVTCPDTAPTSSPARVHCSSHAGTYFGEMDLVTASGDRLTVRSGDVREGLREVTVNARSVGVGEAYDVAQEKEDNGHGTAKPRETQNSTQDAVDTQDAALSAAATTPSTPSTSASTSSAPSPSAPYFSSLRVHRSSPRSLTVYAGLYELLLENSDRYVDLVQVKVRNWTALMEEVRPEGLMGCTWNATAPMPPNEELHRERDSDLHGCNTETNQHSCRQGHSGGITQ